MFNKGQVLIEILIVLAMATIITSQGFYFLKNLPEALKINAKLSHLDFEKRIGQLFIVGFEGKTLTSEIKNLFKAIHPGGVILFSRNIENAGQLKKLISDLQELSLKDTGLPLFVAIDQEGGPVRRINWIKDNIGQAEIQTPEQAYQIGLTRGKALKRLGINLNLSPVLDIAKKGDFIYNRCFRGTTEKVGLLGKSLISGQKDAGIFSCIKHFPGYGGISFNPETKIVPTVKEIPEISQFQKAFEAKPECIMTANVIYLNLDKKLPFTLSPKGIQFLRKQIKGDYLIISDELSSKALKDKFTLEKTVILAKKAGVDLLLIAGWNQPSDSLKAFKAISEAVKNGEIQMNEINKSVLKIIQLKQKISFQATRKMNLQERIKNAKTNFHSKTSEKFSKKKERDEGSLNIINKFVNWGYRTPPHPRLIDTIIIHSSYNALGKNPYSVEGVLKEYKMYGVSPHYLIDRKGNIFRLVKEQNIAYHAGQGRMPDGRININNFSIGIEMIYTKSDTPNEVQYKALVKLVKLIKSKYKIKYILGHKDIAPERKSDPWNFDWQKFNSEISKISN